LAAADGYKMGAADRTNQGRRMERSEGYGLAIRFLFLTGARASEVLTAHWNQFESFAGGRLIWRVGMTKSGLPNVRVLDADLSKRLLEWKPQALAIMAVREGEAKRAPLWVFPQLRNPALPVRRIENAWREIKKAAGVSEGRIHDIRHTVASHLRRSGQPLTTIQAQLGHRSMHTTLIYSHAFAEGAADTGALIGTMLERMSKEEAKRAAKEAA